MYEFGYQQKYCNGSLECLFRPKYKKLSLWTLETLVKLLEWHKSTHPLVQGQDQSFQKSAHRNLKFKDCLLFKVNINVSPGWKKYNSKTKMYKIVIMSRDSGPYETGILKTGINQMERDQQRIYRKV